MRKTLFLCVVALGAAQIFVAPSWADTDYPCLDACVKGGKTASACLSLCTHDQTADRQKSETDYRCLNLCTRGGKPAAACLSQCTYTKATGNASNNLRPSPPAMAEGAWASSHDVLQAPVPVGDTILIAPSLRALAKPDKNYACIPQCLHDGMQVELCNQNCAAVTPEFNAGH